jgi:FKBP-type peptidyl-prolyl cis-trans isomerase 2
MISNPIIKYRPLQHLKSKAPWSKKNIMTKIKNNDTVEVHYKGTLTDGQVFDSSLEREPLKFTMGQGQLIPGFEAGLIDMEVKEKKTIHIPSAEAYGPRRDDMMHEVQKTQLPPEIKPEVGMPLVSQTPEGQQMHFTIAEVREESIVVDGNHPLAGKDLTFEIEVVSINK